MNSEKDRSVISFMNDMWEKSGAAADPMSAIHFFVDGKPANENVFDSIATEITEKLELTSKHSLLEVGCGNGLLLKRLRKRAKTVTGTDFSAALLEGINDPTIEVHHAEANKSPFKNNSFDRVVCHSVFHYFPNIEYATETIQDMLRVCKPGGKVMISDIFNGYLKEYYKREEYRLLPLSQKVISRLRKIYYRMRKIDDVFVDYPFFITPSYFKEFAKKHGHRAQLFLETVTDKPAIFLAFRYDAVLTKKV